MRSKKGLKALTGGVALALSSLVATLPASAASKSATTTVSCDGTTVKNLVQVNHVTQGTFSIKANSASQDSITNFSAESHTTGNSLSWKAADEGQTATWNSVLVAVYTGKAKRVGNKNCNGSAPGHGNYTLNYTITYNG